jgi:hypothetical protein
MFQYQRCVINSIALLTLRHSYVASIRNNGNVKCVLHTIHYEKNLFFKLFVALQYHFF